MDDSVSASLRELGVRTTYHSRLLVAGAMVSLVGIGLTVAGVQMVPPTYVFVSGLAIVLVSMFLAFHDVRIERDVNAERLKPVFELSDNEQACYQVGENDVQGRFQTRKLIIRNI